MPPSQAISASQSQTLVNSFPNTFYHIVCGVLFVVALDSPLVYTSADKDGPPDVSSRVCASDIALGVVAHSIHMLQLVRLLLSLWYLLCKGVQLCLQLLSCDLICWLVRLTCSR